METYVFIVYTNIGDYEDFKVFDTLFKAQKELKESFEKILVSNVTVKSEEELRKQFDKNEGHWFDIEMFYDEPARGCIRKRKVL